MSGLKSYQRLDQETGEIVSKFKYLKGDPKQYRFNGQNGQFNIEGKKIITDTKGQPVKSFTITPMAWRIFEENLFGRNRKDLWGELFFVDEKNCVSSIMLNNTSLQEFLDLARELHYEEIPLNSIQLTMTPEKITAKQPLPDGTTPSWFITRLTWEEADAEVVKAYTEFSGDFPVYRADTLTDTAVYRFKSDNFRLPEPAISTVLDIATTPVLLPE